MNPSRQPACRLNEAADQLAAFLFQHLFRSRRCIHRHNGRFLEPDDYFLGEAVEIRRPLGEDPQRIGDWRHWKVLCHEVEPSGGLIAGGVRNMPVPLTHFVPASVMFALFRNKFAGMGVPVARVAVTPLTPAGYSQECSRSFVPNDMLVSLTEDAPVMVRCKGDTTWSTFVSVKLSVDWFAFGGPMLTATVDPHITDSDAVGFIEPSLTARVPSLWDDQRIYLCADDGESDLRPLVRIYRVDYDERSLVLEVETSLEHSLRG